MNSNKLLALALLCAFGTTACSRTNAPLPNAVALPPAAVGTSAAAPVVAAAPFDVSSVPVSTMALPPFPYLAWPRDLDENLATEKKEVEFDAVPVLAGSELRTVEGKIDELGFVNSAAKYSALSSRRNYAAAIAALGGVKVNPLQPEDEALVSKYGERLASLDADHVGGGGTYDVYLIRTAERNI